MRSRHAWLLCATLVACDPFSTSDPAAPAEAGVEDAARPDAATGGGGDAAVDAGNADVARKDKRVFVTASGYGGNLVQAAKAIDASFAGDGLAAADRICKAEAAVAGGGSYKAWISVTGKSALDRFTDKGPRISTTGARILDAVGTPPLVAVPGPDGKTPSGERLVWTGTLSGGIPAAANCDGWTNGTLIAIAGDANATNKNWTESRYGHQCGVGDVHLYCLED